MSDVVLPRPEPVPGQRHQPGIVDPAWPPAPPTTPGVDPDKYAKTYAGQIERQRHLHVVTADVTCVNRDELKETLKTLTGFALHQMAKRPPTKDVRPYDGPVVSRRVTVTVGFGATLFTTVDGDDRFDLSGRRPASLKVMPQIEGDVPEFHPVDTATDLVVLIASDDYYVNEYILGRLLYGAVPHLKVRGVERGYARPDSREPSGFEDGLTNPKGGAPGSPMEAAVFIGPNDPEPDWCVGGAYLAYRKVRRRLERFFALSGTEQQQVFGVDKEGVRITTPAPESHAQKMNPMRGGHRDLLGLEDESRRFLRRPYFFDDGVGADGQEVRGVHHLSFTRDLVSHYEWPVLMWQTNPDFPTKGAGQDRLYKDGGAANIGGGYYFVPPAAEKGGMIGEGLFEA
jgi:deferrochelatase/peroxidase EfeB